MLGLIYIFLVAKPISIRRLSLLFTIDARHGILSVRRHPCRKSTKRGVGNSDCANDNSVAHTYRKSRCEFGEIAAADFGRS